MRLYREVGRAASPEGWTGRDHPRPRWSWWEGLSRGCSMSSRRGSWLPAEQGQSESRGACVAWARGDTLSCPRCPGSRTPALQREGPHKAVQTTGAAQESGEIRLREAQVKICIPTHKGSTRGEAASFSRHPRPHGPLPSPLNPTSLYSHP